MRRASRGAILWTFFLLVLCWTPSHRMPIGETTPSFFRRFHGDKLVHCGMFAVYAFLWRRATSPVTVPVIAASGLALAIITEVGQATPLVGRDASLWDGIADTVGVGLGLVLANHLYARVPTEAGSSGVADAGDGPEDLGDRRLQP